MKLALLLSGGKDSVYSGYIAHKAGNELACAITMVSKNKDSFMFHTPSIRKTCKQAEAMGIPCVIKETSGVKEEELDDLEDAIFEAKKKYHITGIVTGAIKSVYQATRVQKICDKHNLKCFNPLWQSSEIEYLQELIDNHFKIILVGVFAYPLDETWLGREIDKKFIEEMKDLEDKYDIHPAGEGGEFETFVLRCPLFRRELKVKSFKDTKEGEHSFRRDIEVE
jgi:diphthine-ammonia ligase